MLEPVPQQKVDLAGLSSGFLPLISANPFWFMKTMSLLPLAFVLLSDSIISDIQTVPENCSIGRLSSAATQALESPPIINTFILLSCTISSITSRRFLKNDSVQLVGFK